APTAGEGVLGGAAESMDRAAPVSRQHAGDQATVKLQDAKPQAVISAQPSVLLSRRLVSVNRLRLSVLQTDLTTAVRDPVAPSKGPYCFQESDAPAGSAPWQTACVPPEPPVA